MRYDQVFAMQVAWCTDKGIPHSQFLDWSVEDQQKVMASLLEERSRCKSCGTSEWEWESDRFAYSAAQHICNGCMRLDAANEDSNRSPGAKMVLVPRKTGGG